MNPIYKEYYPHEDCECYKINIPWAVNAQHKIVLCRVDQGYDYAKTIAVGIITQSLISAIKEENK